MPKRLLKNRVIDAIVAAAILFVILAYFVPTKTLILILNGVFIGCVLASLITYRNLLWDAVRGRYPYDRVRQMTLGGFFLWVAYITGVSVSIVLRSQGHEQIDTIAVAASRYIAIGAAILQVTAPDYGLGFFHGSDRKALWLGIGLGAVAAFCLIFAQATEAISAAP